MKCTKSAIGWGSSTDPAGPELTVIWGPRLDTIVGPHTHPTLPSEALTSSTWMEFWVSPPKKFEIANAIGEFQRRNQVKISEGKIENKAGTYGAMCLRIEGKARTEIERGRDLGREFNEPLPRKCVKIWTWNPAFGNLVHSFNNIVFLYHFSLSLFFL